MGLKYYAVFMGFKQMAIACDRLWYSLLWLQQDYSGLIILFNSKVILLNEIILNLLIDSQIILFRFKCQNFEMGVKQNYLKFGTDSSIVILSNHFKLETKRLSLILSNYHFWASLQFLSFKEKLLFKTINKKLLIETTLSLTKILKN